MNQSNTSNSGLAGRLLADLRRDPKKAAILGVLVLVFLVVGIRMVAKQAGTPRKSSAAGRPAAPTGRSASRGSAPVVSGLSRPPVTVGTSEPEGMASTAVNRDIFTPDETYFPVKRTKEPTEAAPKVAVVVDPNAAAKSLQDEVEAMARALTLQTTVVGEFPTAMINGRVLRVGDPIGGFRVVEISSRSCQLERAGVRVRLEMGR